MEDLYLVKFERKIYAENKVDAIKKLLFEVKNNVQIDEDDITVTKVEEEF